LKKIEKKNENSVSKYFNLTQRPIKMTHTFQTNTVLKIGMPKIEVNVANPDNVSGLTSSRGGQNPLTILSLARRGYGVVREFWPNRGFSVGDKREMTIGVFMGLGADNWEPELFNRLVVVFSKAPHAGMLSEIESAVLPASEESSSSMMSSMLPASLKVSSAPSSPPASAMTREVTLPRLGDVIRTVLDQFGMRRQAEVVRTAGWMGWGAYGDRVPFRLKGVLLARLPHLYKKRLPDGRVELSMDVDVGILRITDNPLNTPPQQARLIMDFLHSFQREVSPGVGGVRKDVVCKFYKSPGGCRKGDNCGFSHEGTPATGSGNVSPPTLTVPPNLMSAFPGVSSQPQSQPSRGPAPVQVKQEVCPHYNFGWVT
jgi:hypothetical protein